MTNKPRAAVYARVSTDSDEQSTSFKSQQKHYTQYTKDNGYEFVKLYSDKGLSATSSNRKAFIEMLHDAGLDATRGDGNLVTFTVSDREPQFDWIIVKDLDRFARNTDAEAVMKALREDKEVYILFENLGFSTKDSDWQLRVGLLLTFAQQESLDKSRKIRDSYQKRARDGKFHMSVNLLGYARNKRTKQYYIVEDQAKIVREIFDLYTKHKKGSYEIGDILNAKGYKTKQGKLFNGNSVLRVLNNEKYKGQVILNRYGTTSATYTNKRVINPKDEWIIIEDGLPKIVSAEQFDKAQEIMASRTRSTVKNKGSNKRQVRGRKIVKNVFYKKIYCGKCQADYIRESAIKTRGGKRVREYFYGCRNRRNTQRNVEKCTNRGISHDVLVRELVEIGKKLADDRFNEWYIDAEEQALNERLADVDKLIAKSDKQKAKIDKQIEDIDTQKKNLFNTLSAGASDTIIRLTQDRIEELEDEQKQLEVEKNKYTVESLEQQKYDYQNKFDEIVELSQKTEYTFDELLEQVTEIQVLNTGRVIVKFETPTLITDLQTTGSFLHQDEHGVPSIMYFFDR